MEGLQVLFRRVRQDHLSRIKLIWSEILDIDTLLLQDRIELLFALPFKVSVRSYSSSIFQTTPQNQDSR